MAKHARKESRTAEVEEELVSTDDRVIGRAMLYSAAGITLAALLVGGVVYWLSRSKPVATTEQSELVKPTARELPQLEVPFAPFQNITEAAGVRFQHVTGARGEKLLPETMGGGLAIFDYDNDGDNDLLFVNGNDWPWGTEDAKPTPTMALYQNDGKGKFTDVTAGSGLDVSFYGMGAAVGDYDGDGWRDVFISAVGHDRLFRNEQGKFVDVTESAGVAGAESEWGTSCCWLDCDNDGDLDLFVGNYVRWSREIDLAQDFRLIGVGRAYGPPLAFEGTFPYLYRNDGDGKFTDISADAGVQIRNQNTNVPIAKTMGVSPFDLDDDGKLDLIVANDTVQNLVFHNEGQGKFREIGAASGIAFDAQGNARGAMGIDTGRFRNDQCLGVAIGNFSNEMTALYVAEDSSLQFFDAALATGLGPPTRLSLTFGVFFFDFDLDGRLDLLSANGHLEEDINKVQPTQFYAQPPRLFWNCGLGQTSEFVPVSSDKCGEQLGERMVGRGSAYGDLDGDGDLDIVIAANGGTPRILRNDQKLGNHWLRLQLVGKGANRDAIGASVRVHVDGQELRRDVCRTRSYLSQSELPLTFGLGKHDQIERIEIRWPDGSSQQVPSLEIDKLHVIEQP